MKNNTKIIITYIALLAFGIAIYLLAHSELLTDTIVNLLILLWDKGLINY